MTIKEFEQACGQAIKGNIWDNSLNKLYTEAVFLSVHEMRNISNALRKREGVKPGELFDPLDEVPL